MDYFMFKGHLATIFLNLGLVTSINFEAPVKSYVYGGKRDEVKMRLINDNKTLVMIPSKKTIDTNLLIITDRAHEFKIKSSDKNISTVNIRKAQINEMYRLDTRSDSYMLFEGKTSSKLVAHEPLMVNEFYLEKDESRYISKGIPLTISRFE